MSTAEDRQQHRREHGLPQPISQTDELLLAIHQELRLLHTALAPTTKPEPPADAGTIELREPAEVLAPSAGKDAPAASPGGQPATRPRPAKTAKQGRPRRRR